MKNSPRYLFILTALLMLGCTGKPIEKVNYYLLSPAGTTSGPSLSERSEWMSLKLLSSAGYLRQQNLAMQLSNNQLYYSPVDLWAEPVHTAFIDALQGALHEKQSLIGFVSGDFAARYQTTANLAIHLDHLLITETGDVILTGRYALEEADDISPNMRSFHFSTALQADGYAHGVNRMRTLITRLAEQIARELDER